MNDTLQKEHVDPLLAELQGLPSDPVSSLPGATAGVQVGPEANPDLFGPSKIDPLDVTDKAPESAVAASAKVHSIAAGGKGYKVRVRGQYYVPASNGARGKITKEYALDFILPSVEKALVTIVTKLLRPALRKLDPASMGFRTHELVDVTPLGGAPAPRHLALMDRKALEAHVAANDVPVKPEEYEDVTNLRDAVIDFTQNPKGFEAREAARQADRKEFAELKKLNEGIL
jgi:hypothetical protein